MDINRRFDSLILKYRVDRFHPRFGPYIQAEQPELLDELIGCYLDIRDFSSAQRLIGEYIQRKFCGWEEKERLQKSLLGLLREIEGARGGPLHRHQQAPMVPAFAPAL